MSSWKNKKPKVVSNDEKEEVLEVEEKALMTI